MNNLIAWVTDKWLTKSPTQGNGFVVWYYVARYSHVEELHIRLRFYADTSRVGGLWQPRADLEFRIRAGLLEDVANYQLFEKEENGLKPIRSFAGDVDLLIHLDTARR